MSVGKGRAAMGWLAFPVRVLLGGLFVFAGVVKLLNPTLLGQAILAFKVPEMHDHLVIVATFVMPWVEILAGAALVVGLWTRAAAGVLAILLVGFVGLLASVIIRGLSVHCSCFGAFEVPCSGPVGACHIGRNVVLLALAWVVVRWGPGPFALDRESAR